MMNETVRAKALWWFFVLLGIFVIYKVLSLDISKITTVEVNASVVEAAKSKLHSKE